MKRVVLILLLIFPLFVSAKEEVKYSKCVDGDTIKVIRNKEEITVRLLAVDTPENTKEKEYYGKEASNYTCESIKNAKKIELEYDPKSDVKDKYDRVLAWVFVDDYLLNDALVRNGYAEVAYVYKEYKYVDTLRNHEIIAKNAQLGIWNTAEKEKYNNNKTEENKDDLLFWIVVITTIICFLLLGGKKYKNKLKKLFKKSKIEKKLEDLWEERMK